MAEREPSDTKPGPPLRIGLLGRGTVGGAFIEMVAERAEAIEAASGRRPEVVGVLSRGAGSFDEILEDSEVIVELIGGIDPALDYARRAIAAGRHLVTANKQLIARHGDELFDAAREAGVQLRFEAAVAGAIPAIRVISESLAATRIDRVSGIVNGTTNFILSEMAHSGSSYPETLARAQALGYAEADPTEDVSGADAAAKMAILARLAFHTPVPLEHVTYEGIEQVSADDLAYARELDLSLKLLGVAERRDDGISVRVFPCFLYPGHPLAPVQGPFNAITVEAPDITEITISGPGAGGRATASAVLGDVVSIAAGEAPVHQVRETLPIAGDVESAFYLHLEVADEPGVLARVAEVLAGHGISVRSVVQRGLGDDARLVMVTHRCPEDAFAAGLSELAALKFMRAEPRSIRVLEEEFS